MQNTDIQLEHLLILFNGVQLPLKAIVNKQKVATQSA